MDHDKAFCTTLQNSLNSILKIKSQDQLQAIPYEHSEKRTYRRNGSRARDLKTRVERITLTVPRHRNLPFKTMIFDNDSRSESTLITAIADMVVDGISTRKVTRVIEALCRTDRQGRRDILGFSAYRSDLQPH